MKEIYDWVPWFRELAGKIAEGGEQYLIDKAKAVDWGVENPALLQYGDENIDPFSFFYFLASKNTAGQRPIRNDDNQILLCLQAPKELAAMLRAECEAKPSKLRKTGFQ